MPNSVAPDPRHPLRRAMLLAVRARELDARDDRAEAVRCRRLAFPWVHFYALTRDDQPAPNQWALERLIAANIACDQPHENAAA